MGKAYGHKSCSKNDNLQTPYSMTRQLLELDLFSPEKLYLEPCCGSGAIVRILQQAEFNNLYYSDINHAEDQNKIDFLNYYAQYQSFDHIITNPPFSLFNEFILKAQKVARKSFAFLGKLDFLTGLERFKTIYNYNLNYRLKNVFIFIRKPDLRHELREDGKYPCGIDGYAWFYFENNYIKNPVISWINNQKYVLSANENTCQCEICKDK